MRTNKLIILLLLVFCQCANDNNEASEKRCESIQYDEFTTIFCGTTTDCFPVVSDKYAYPQTQGPWIIDVSTEDPYDKFCQLPNDILKSISTPGLVDALIHAPYFTGFYLLSDNSSTLKWHMHYGRFNSADELFKRKDADAALVAYYKLVCFDFVTAHYTGIHEEYEKLLGLECLFTKQEILDKMNHEKKKEAVAAFLINCKKQDYNDCNRIYPMAHIMLADEYEPIVKYSQEYIEEFRNTLEGYDYPSNPNQYDIIVSFAKEFIKDEKRKI